METDRNELGTMPIGTLLVRYSVPGMVSMLVNSIYNLVDQIFIGNGVGYLGNAATTVAFPFVTVCIAFSLLFNHGNMANVSLNLGAGNREAADRSAGSAAVFSVIAGCVILILGSVFLRPLLLVFGATPNVMPYAVDYTRIILLGFPFVTAGMVLGGIIRVDGSPRLAMAVMLAGAVFNTVFDPIFIFVFHWGVKGAALATIMGQAVTLILGIAAMRRLKNLNFRREYLRPDFAVAKRVAALGSSSFINQMGVLVLQIAINNTVTHYGALSVYGEDIPLTCMGIVMKVNQVMIALLIGIAGGAQPISGFNYGARQYGRVKKTYLMAVAGATGVAAAGFVVFHFFPQYIVALFGKGNELYESFAVLAFRTVLLLVCFSGVQLVSANFFQSIGKPMRAMVLTASRQLLFFLPAVLILPRFFGIVGALWAFPISDGLAFLLAAGLVWHEMRILTRMEAEEKCGKEEPE